MNSFILAIVMEGRET